MLEGYWLIAEGAAVAGPTVAGAAWVVAARRRVRRWLREPLFWTEGQPVSLVTIFAELNGEGNVLESLAEILGTHSPLSAAELERGVRMLQGNTALCRNLILDAATDAVFHGAIAKTSPATAGVELAERLSAASAELDFFRFMAFLNGERAASASPLLPVEGLLAGGLPVDGADEDELGGRGSKGVLGVLDALRGSGEGGWLPTIARAVEEVLRDWRVKKARDQVQRAYVQAGAQLIEAMRRRSPAGQAVYRNVYSPLDSYRTLSARVRSQEAERRGGMFVPSAEAILWREYGASLEQAIKVVKDKCASFERVLSGQAGPATAGEVLYRHRHVLLGGVAPDAFGLGGIDAAKSELRLAMEQAAT